MDPASAAPVAGSAGIPAAPRTPASSPPSAGRSRTDVPPPADSSPPHTPLAAPARTVPRLSSLRPLPILAEDLLLPDFCSGPAARLSGRFIEGFFHRRSHLAAKLRPGNVHSAEGWEELLLPEIECQQQQGKEVVFRADAAFAKPELYEALEEREVKYAIRLPANDNLERDIAELLTRPVGRPSYKPVVWFKSFLYQAASWRTARRVV